MPDKPAIQINSADGSVQLGSRVFANRTSLEQAREAAAVLIYRENDVGNGYFWLSLGDLLLEGQSASMGLCFFHGELEMVTLGVAMPDDKLIEGWPTEETSQRHVRFMQKGLERQLQVKFDDGAASFSWGSAWSRFDLKGFMASAGVVYARQR